MGASQNRQALAGDEFDSVSTDADICLSTHSLPTCMHAVLPYSTGVDRPYKQLKDKAHGVCVCVCVCVCCGVCVV